MNSLVKERKKVFKKFLKSIFRSFSVIFHFGWILKKAMFNDNFKMLIYK